MKGIKEIEIEGEKVFVKKSNVFGWRLVNPYKIDGKINWKNLLIGGSWMNVIKLAIYIFIVITYFSEYANVIEIANECLSRSPIIILP